MFSKQASIKDEKLSHLSHGFKCEGKRLSHFKVTIPKSFISELSQAIVSVHYNRKGLLCDVIFAKYYQCQTCLQAF